MNEIHVEGLWVGVEGGIQNAEGQIVCRGFQMFLFPDLREGPVTAVVRLRTGFQWPSTHEVRVRVDEKIEIVEVVAPNPDSNGLCRWICAQLTGPLHRELLRHRIDLSEPFIVTLVQK